MNNLNNKGSVELSTDKKGITTITFGHPQSNSLPTQVLQSLAEAIKTASKQGSTKVILLKSLGDRAFCGGASFDELIAIENIEQGELFFSGFASVINAIRKCPKFVVGRVQGKAVGGGVGLASAVDICYATKHSAIKLSELAVGIGPFVVGPAVERKMGKSATTIMTIKAFEWYTADWAYENNLYAELFETSVDMDNGLDELLSKLINYNPQAMEELKTIFWEGTENWDQLLKDRAKISGKLVLSDFTKQFIKSFKVA